MGLAEDIVLEELVKAKPGPEFNELLRRHGPILPEETTFLLEKAKDSNPQVRSNAIRLLQMVRGQEAREAALRKLATESDDPQVRALAASGLPDGEEKLRQILVDPDARRRYPLDAIYQALSQSDDPTTAEAFRKSLEGADMNAELSLVNALRSSPSRKPWLQALLLDLAGRDGHLRWKYFDLLADWGADAPAAELVKLCVDHLEKFSSTDYNKNPVAQIGDQSGVASCLTFLRRLAGRSLEMQEALAFAREWKGRPQR